jgi:hypothetical protein
MHIYLVRYGLNRQGDTAMNTNGIYKFTFDGNNGMVRVYPNGSKQVMWGGMTFQYEAAQGGLKLAIDRSIK